MDMKRSTPGPTTRINSKPIAAVKEPTEGDHNIIRDQGKKDQNSRSLEGDSKQHLINNISNAERQRVQSYVSFKEPLPMQENNEPMALNGSDEAITEPKEATGALIFDHHSTNVSLKGQTMTTTQMAGVNNRYMSIKARHVGNVTQETRPYSRGA